MRGGGGGGGGNSNSKTLFSRDCSLGSEVWLTEHDLVRVNGLLNMTW